MKFEQFKTTWAGKDLIVETGKLAGQANGAVTVRYGDTLILATATIGKLSRPGVNYLPLMVDYEERFYAAGKIKGSRWVKREGRPSEEAILTGRLIDRAIRPLFDKHLRHDVQVVITVFSIDDENDPDIPSILGASLALQISDIPFQGPIAACRVIKKQNEFIVNAAYNERKECEFDLVIAGSEKKINMLEGEAREIPEQVVFEAILKSQEEIEPIIKFQKEITAIIGKKKQIIAAPNLPPELKESLKNIINKHLTPENIIGKNKEEYSQAMDSLRKEVCLKFPEESPDFLEQFIEESLDKFIHTIGLEKSQRQDGRGLTDIRPLYSEVGIFPRTHGSGLFSRGDTQIASALTLASPGSELFLDTMGTEGRKRFMHHYNFPGYSVGEVSPMRGPGRREIGHGFLVEKALKTVLPDKEQFPYTVRIVSETLSSNGSSSMASVCASSLSLMDAGVPIKKHVAGISMGLISDKSGLAYKILTDIQGPEDHHGDMDFKIAGTKDGVTAMQMDVKISGISLEIIKAALTQAAKSRKIILEAMERVIEKPRPEVSPFAPRIETIKINPEKIGKVIGPGGKTINEITEKTGADIDIEDDGTISVTSKNQAGLKKALAMIREIIREAEPGEIYTGKIRRVSNIGLFLEILPGQDGLLHSSEIREKAINSFRLGETLRVKVKDIDSYGRINLALA